ncbi:conjugal transfer protein TraH [Acidithiobacillus ferrooxidans]|uniref:Pilus assembly protein TraH, putative n=1 Tax=Acidithiobacillus ferrooxidans (strain ATCC 23270 / DSM 14882 / CIP 104768 / NCIMB 8455) TaxID=243159 RepID=B7J815_ACIF2|nr:MULTISPECIES: conjugal transfer protein TraH [Acidithiobacillus]ACK78317.1 pilus assembly protein TraH, putative [Acidithiobacillus ferrooxidans ATCC 23270]MBN6744938.1 conjugal transfer protein TraH [Acidithiobacillus sp. MC2.2]MBN6747878.1 conjugal transfer protein TraH [Acidithiobacillus sp. PG05]
MQQAHPELKKITKGVLVATLTSVLTSGFLNAESQALGMQNFVNQMFIASSGATAAGSGNGVTYSGGYFEARTPLSGANVIAFSPPDISAGCGGINLFFGSFHFINGQEFMALLREIGQQALGYAFQLAIDAMCHQCGALLSMIEKDIQDMNNALKNTCQLAKGIFNGDDMGDIAQVVNQTRRVMSSAVGDVSDIFKGTEPAMSSTIASDETSISTNWTELMTSVGLNGQAAKTPVPKTAPQAYSLPQYNMFWKAINAADTQDMLLGLSDTTMVASVPEAVSTTNSNICATTTETTNACTKEILMSLVGTLIILPGESTNSSNASGAATQNQTNNTATGNINSNTLAWGASLNLQQLVNGISKAPVWQCTYRNIGGTHYQTFGPVTGCIGPLGTTTLGGMGYVGIKTAVRGYLLGGYVGGVYHNGLVNDLNMGITPSAATLAFEQGMPYGTATILQDAETGNQNDPGVGLMAQIAKLLEPYIVDEFAVKFGDAALDAVGVYNGQNHIIVPPDYKFYLAALNAQIQTYETKESLNDKNVRLAEELVQSAKARIANASGGKV